LQETIFTGTALTDIIPGYPIMRKALSQNEVEKGWPVSCSSFLARKKVIALSIELESRLSLID
jgi:hypothetical protein